MDDAELLSTAAFFLDDYAPKGKADLWAVAAKRGITNDSVKAFRSASFPGILFKVRCASCRGSFGIGEEHFVAGRYKCPHCHFGSWVRYTELEIAESELVAAARLLIADSVLGVVLEERRRAARRAAIMDGSYWRELRKLITKGQAGV